MESVEFYNTPEGDVMYKQLGKPVPVSYTHLDVYKRQVIDMVKKTTVFHLPFRMLLEKLAL